MTDKAPERDEITALIDFLHGAGPNKDGQWFDEVAQTEQGAFWWRKDLRQIERLATDHALALVAAENQACAKIVWPHHPAPPRKPKASDGPEYRQAYEVQKLAWKNVCEIRARTPTDATAALERVKREAYERGVREAAEAAFKRLRNWVWVDTGDEFVSQRKATDEEVRDAAFAKIKGETDG